MSCGGCAERRAWIGAKVDQGLTALQRWFAGERGQTPEQMAEIADELERTNGDNPASKALAEELRSRP